jgi:hypothetical protein
MLIVKFVSLQHVIIYGAEEYWPQKFGARGGCLNLEQRGKFHQHVNEELSLRELEGAGGVVNTKMMDL